MKKKIKQVVIVIVTVLGTFHVQAQNHKSDLSYVSHVDFSADKVWEQIRKMDNIDKISSFVGKVEWIGPKGVGGTRVCTAPDGKGKFKEKIMKFDDIDRTYTWQVVEGVPAKKVENSFRVVDMGLNKSMIVWTSNYEFLKNPNMTEIQFRAFLQGAVTEMVENMVGFIK